MDFERVVGAKINSLVEENSRLMEMIESKKLEVEQVKRSYKG